MFKVYKGKQDLATFGSKNDTAAYLKAKNKRKARKNSVVTARAEYTATLDEKQDTIKKF